MLNYFSIIEEERFSPFFSFSFLLFFSFFYVPSESQYDTSKLLVPAMDWQQTRPLIHDKQKRVKRMSALQSGLRPPPPSQFSATFIVDAFI